MRMPLESLTPDERAVFVLHDVFGFALAEIAKMAGKRVALPFAAASATRTLVKPVLTLVFQRILAACARDLEAPRPRPSFRRFRSAH